ncbi:unnamed protein product [Ambrosiozyma monospora]|uniref:Unnamed protein product n=1 Tax=Ambrosiozyma monospora TaxID=43982 RepID=A0A9W6T6I5_AMBMO|nr:unnamed protein product [Ambrosiozyma monospora]
MAQSAELNNARLEDEIKDKTIQLNTLKEMVDDKVKRLQQLEAEKEELLNIINQLNKDQDLLKEELNACLITIDDLKNGLRQKSVTTKTGPPTNKEKIIEILTSQSSPVINDAPIDDEFIGMLKMENKILEITLKHLTKEIYC